MSSYANKTSVSTDRSLTEIRQIVMRYGATAFSYVEEKNQVAILFKCDERMVRIEMTLPDPKDKAFTVTDTGRSRTQSASQEAWQQECRRMWRALALVIKAKLEAVASGITTFDEEFLAHIVLPNGKTVGNSMIPQMREALANNAMPALLPRN